MCKLNCMNKAQFLHIITSLCKLRGVHTRSCCSRLLWSLKLVSQTVYAHRLSYMHQKTKVVLHHAHADVVGDNSAEFSFHTYITQERALSIMYTLMLLQKTTRKGFVTHITQKRAETSVHTVMLSQVTVNTKCFVTYISSIRDIIHYVAADDSLKY